MTDLDTSAAAVRRVIDNLPEDDDYAAPMLQALSADLEAMRAERDGLLKRVAELEGAMRPCLAMLDALVAESGKSVEYGEEDAFRRGEWFEAEDVAAIAATRAALSGEAGE